MGAHGKPLRRSKYPSMSAPGHPLAQKDGRIRVHRKVLYDRIGPGPHKCNWCYKEVVWGPRGPSSLVVDHVNGDTWDNSPKNLVPACNACNSGRSLRERTRCKNGHEWNDENTWWRPLPNGRQRRQCRACSRNRKKKDPLKSTASTMPERVGLPIPLSGLTVGHLREFVAALVNVDDSMPVYATYGAYQGTALPPKEG